MGTLVLGIILGLLALVIIGFIGFSIYDVFDMMNEIVGIIHIVVTIVLCVVVVIAIPVSMCSYDKLQSTCYIERYNSVKTTMEESLDSDKISGMERLQLVQSAIDENKYLVQKQFDCQQWYGFLIDKDVLKLDPIDFN